MTGARSRLGPTSEGPCTIRPLELSDVDAVFAAVQASRAELALWMPWCRPDYGRAQTEQWLTHDLGLRAQGMAYQFAILQPSGALGGVCALSAIDGANLRANLGYWVRTELTGRGFATGAARLLAAWAFASTPLNRLEVIVAAGNHASQRVAEKAGAVREGVARARLMLHGRAHDAVVYAIVRPFLLAERFAPGARMRSRAK